MVNILTMKNIFIFCTLFLLIQASCSTMSEPSKLIETKTYSILIKTDSSGSLIYTSPFDARSLKLPWMKNAQKISSELDLENDISIILVSLNDKCIRNEIIVFSPKNAFAEEVGECNQDIRLYKIEDKIAIVNDNNYSSYRVSATDLVKIRGPIKNSTSK